MSNRNGNDRPAASEAALPTPMGRAGLMASVWRTVLVLLSGALLSVVVVVASMGLLGQVTTPTPTGPPKEPPAECDRVRDDELERLAEQRWGQFLEDLRREPFPETGHAIESHIDAAFEPVYARIPGFLDWHYSITGQYTELALAIVDQLQDSELARAALNRLQDSELALEVLALLRRWELAEAALDQLQAVPDQLQATLDQLQQGVDSRLLADVPDQIQHAAANIETVMKEELRDLIAQRIHDELQTLPSAARVQTGTPCFAGGTAGLRMAYERMLRAAIPLTVRRFTDSAVPTGIVAVGAGVGGALAGRALVKGLARRLSARTAGRAIGVAVGGLGASAVAWLLVDAVVLLVDEHFNRDDLERELTALVDEQKAEMKAAMSGAVDQAKQEALGPITPSELNGRD